MGAIREIKVIGRNYELSAFVDEEDYQTLKLWDYRWHRIIGRTTTYVKTYKNGKEIRLHRLIMGTLYGARSVYVDHIDGNGLNNYRANLRITDNRGNQRNRRKSLSAKYSSSYKGVNLHSGKRSKPWEAHIVLSGKQKHLGCYRTEIEAARSYNNAAIEHYGTMAHLNVIGP